ncbi:rab-like protein 6 isoform X2 [Acropora palmata]|uniref:rab-like protein 6 isoform X2 n=1 Tax=Acropora palmata TaxID=6131 RepID=UPI003D9FBD32
MLSALKKWAKGGNDDSKLTTPMGVRAMCQALQRKFARGIQYNMKIIIKGDRNTGKSCLFQRLQGKPHNEQYIPTNEIQVASIHWNYRATDDVVKVEVWDVVDKGRSKKPSLSGLKLENDKTEGEKDATVLDAEFVDVYKGAHGVLMMMDITKPWTFKYVERELNKVPPHLPVLVLANHRDMGEHRLVQTEEAVALIEHLERPDRSPPVHYAETSMKNGFGLKYIHKFLNLPFLLLQRETLLKQLQVNAEDTESTLEELLIHKETEEQDYEKFVSMLEKRKKNHEARKAAAAAAAAASSETTESNITSPASKSSVETAANKGDNKEFSEGNAADEKTLKRVPSATRTEATQGAVPQNGLVHSATEIDEFVPGDELDAAFLDEDKNASRKKANKPEPEKKPAKVSVDDSEESDSDSETRNPMVAGFAEDIDSEDESTTVSAAIANEIEDSNVNYPSKTVGKAVVVSVDLTSSEEEEIVEKSDDEKERNEKEWKKNEDERSTDKEDKESKSNGVKLNKEMPAISSWTGTSIDGFGPGAEGFDDWLNSPDADLKVSPIETELVKGRNTGTSSKAPSSSATDIPVDEWEKFMNSQMQPQPDADLKVSPIETELVKGRNTGTSSKAPSSSATDIPVDEWEKFMNSQMQPQPKASSKTDEESKSRQKEDHKSGDKSKTKHKHRKHKDKTDDAGESEKKERKKSSRHKEGNEGKERRKSKDGEGEKKKKRRSKHIRSKEEEADQEGVTYEVL